MSFAIRKALGSVELKAKCVLRIAAVFSNCWACVNNLFLVIEAISGCALLSDQIPQTLRVHGKVEGLHPGKGESQDTAGLWPESKPCLRGQGREGCRW